MYIMWRFVVFAAVFVMACCEERESPCPDRFRYENAELGRWTGALNLFVEYKLHGTWTRLLFDAPVKDVRVINGEFDVIQSPDEKMEVLVKNRNFTLKKNVPEKLQISVGYDGTQVPALTGYRLNGRTVCPSSDE